jgi:cation diffusion facilitator CzcD-associated flavoprotein CzcO
MTPDVGARHGPAGHVRKACVIGAGTSGFVAAKVLLGRAHDVAVAGRSRDLGGVRGPSRS